MISRRLSTPFLALLTILTTGLLALALGAPAQAHSELVSSSPEDGAELEAAPTEIVLEFNEEITEIGTQVVVVDPEGTPVAQDEVVVDGSTVTQAIGAGAAGEYTFTVAAASTTTEATTESTTETTSDATSESTAEPSTAVTTADPEAEEPSDGSLTWIVVALILVAAVAVGLVIRRSRAR